jgi:acyl-CoA synthetase (NDP forming)
MENKLKQFESIFYPQSVAVVGASQDMRKTGGSFLAAIIEAGFKGKLYPVNPNEDEILGLRTYPNLRVIPDPVDYVIVLIPRAKVLDVLDDCAAKGVKAVQLFSAGFSESDEAEGFELEKRLAQKARAGGFRLIGPNCIGVYSPCHRLPFIHPELLMGEAGSVAFISHSGGQLVNMVSIGIRRGIKFSKAVSFGNGVDLDSVDFLEYLGADAESKIIGAYLEGVKEGRRFLHVVKEIAKEKPIVIWKGGRTEAGAKAAASHTGALAGSDAVWTAALRQAGAIKVESIEELADALLVFQDLPPLKESKLVVIGGLFDGAGGYSVAATDACASTGLNIPPFGDNTRRKLNAIFPQVGTILKNPVDTGGALILDLNKYQELLQAIVADPDTNVILLIEAVEVFLQFLSLEAIYALNDVFIDLNQRKPFVIVSPPGLAERERLLIEEKLSAAQIPIYPTVERAAKAILHLTQYWRFRGELNESAL